MALILGIESSCDETAAAILDSAAPTLARRIVALHIASLKGLDQAAADKQFGRITGLLYRPHIARRQWRITAAFARWFSAGPTPAVIADAPAARRAGLPLVGLVVAEFRLIGAGKLFLALAALVAAFGMIGEYRHAGSPAAMLLLIFGMTAHAGRSEARKLLTLSNVAPLGPMLRRIAFLVAGLGWTLLLAAPAAVAHLSPAPLLLAAETGAATSLVAIILAAFSGSAFAPRLVLIVGWYF